MIGGSLIVQPFSGGTISIYDPANLLLLSGTLANSVRPGALGRTFNVACGQQYSLLHLIASLNAILGTSIAPTFAPPRSGDVRDSLADISEARVHLGCEPTVGLDEGLQRSIQYYRSLL